MRSMEEHSVEVIRKISNSLQCLSQCLVPERLVARILAFIEDFETAASSKSKGRGNSKLCKGLGFGDALGTLNPKLEILNS